MVFAFFSFSFSSIAIARRSGRKSNRFPGSTCPTMTHCLMPRSVKAEIIFESCPTFSQTMSSTSAASSGFVSPSNATATSRFTPRLRACLAKNSGNERLPAMRPRVLARSDTANTVAGPTGQRQREPLTKIQNPKSKFQTNSNFQTPITSKQERPRFSVLKFGFSLELGSWCWGFLMRLEFQGVCGDTLRHENLFLSPPCRVVRRHYRGPRRRNSLLRIAHLLRRSWQTGRAQRAFPESYDADF